MIEIVDNLEFVGAKKKLMVVKDMFITVDEEKRVLLVNDIVDAAYIDISKKSILRKVNSDVAQKIEIKLNITLAEYGVKVFDDAQTISYKELLATI